LAILVVDCIDKILDCHETLALGSETVQSLGTASFLISVALWTTNNADLSVANVSTILLLGCVLLLTTTIWIPRAVVQLWSAPFLFRSWKYWWLVSRLVWPLTVGVVVAEEFFRRLAGKADQEEDEEEAFENEIRTIVTAGMRDGLLEEDAREMIEGVMELGDVDVSDIMTPRSEVDAIDVNRSVREIIDFVIEVGRTRIPVYHRSLNEVVGILYAKDLLARLAEVDEAESIDVRELVRDAWSVPKTKPVDDLLQDFLRNRNHMAIVVDEYEAVEGVVTIEDALEEIVGEITDEYDKDVEQPYVRIDGNTVDATARMHLDEINEELGLNLAEPDDHDTIAGYMISHLGYLPKEGESIVSDGLRLTVLASSRRRIERIRIEILQKETPTIAENGGRNGKNGRKLA
jgi:CBS domain containing-hemolysin-like protein